MNLPNPAQMPRASLLCAACGKDTSGDGGGVLTLSIRKVGNNLECHHIRYHRACVPPDDRQVHASHQELVDRAIAASAAGHPPGELRQTAPPVRRTARVEVKPPVRVSVEKTMGDGQVILAAAPGAPLYKLVAEFEPPRGFATVVYNEIHAMMGVNLPISAAEITQRILENGEYHRLAPKAAAAKDPTKPVSVTLEKWVAEGRVVRG